MAPGCFDLIVPFTDDYIEGFHALREKKYGYRNRDKTDEIGPLHFLFMDHRPPAAACDSVTINDRSPI